jgi:hypothetical protein
MVFPSKIFASPIVRAKSGWALVAEVVVELINDPLTDLDDTTEYKGDGGTWAADANGANQPGIQTSHPSLAWGTVVAAQLLPDPAAMTEGQYAEAVCTVHGWTGGSNQKVWLQLFGDADNWNGMSDSFSMAVKEDDLALFKRVGFTDASLDTDTQNYAPGDVFKLRVTKAAAGWDLKGYVNDVEYLSVAGATHAGTLGQFTLVEVFGDAASAVQVKNVVVTTNVP